MFMVDLLMETAVDWKGARVLAVLEYFLFNLFTKESRTTKCLFKEYRAVLLVLICEGRRYTSRRARRFIIL